MCPEIVAPFPTGTRDLALLQMRPEGLWGQSSLLCNECLGLFPRVVKPDVMTITHPHLVSRLNSEAIHLLPCMSPRTGQVYLLPSSYFSCRTAGYRSVSGRSCDRPSRHIFSWFPCVYKHKWMLRWFPRLLVATACFSCSYPLPPPS